METAGVASGDQNASLLQKMTLDSQNKDIKVSDDVKKPSDRNVGLMHKSNVTNGQVRKYDRSAKLQPNYVDQSMYYANNYPYFYGGFGGTAQDWDDYRRYFHAEGAEVPAGVYGKNGTLIYHPYVYPPCATYSPAAFPGPNINAQKYQRTAPYSSMKTTSTPFTPGATTVDKRDLKVVEGEIQKLDGSNLNVKGGIASAKPLYSNAAFNSQDSSQIRGTLAEEFPTSDHQDIKLSSGNNAYRNQNMHPHRHLLTKAETGNGAASGFMNMMLNYPVHSGYGYISNGYDSRLFGQGWLSVDPNGRSRGQGHGFHRYGNEYLDGLNELNRGPRSKLRNLPKPSTVIKDNGVPESAVAAQENDKISVSPVAESYNLPDFPVDYADAKFFIIKSYSEDDLHKSVKYNVWASTPNGNKKLDAAYKQAQEKSAPCPVFLFFSVNASGQFVGVAEMMGSVDFDKNLEYWQQDKWNGCFSLKWHIVKDVPNMLLKHIIIQSNENKPVTNSRDTQEVNLEQGLQMLKIFKEHSPRTSILDDFEFYESRQKAIQEKKVRVQFQKQVWEGNAINLKSQDGMPHPLEAVSKLTNEAVQNVLSNGDSNSLQNGSVAKTGDGHKVSTTILVNF